MVKFTRVITIENEIYIKGQYEDRKKYRISNGETIRKFLEF